MLVFVNFSALKETKWYQYAVRFVLGGLITAGAGMIAKKFGPSFGGLFLAFPAIFPASATLIEKHERERKEQKGLNGIRTARKAVSADAAGAAIGGLALIAFGCFVWKTLPHWGTGITLGCATVLWLAASGLMWFMRKRHWLRKSFHAIFGRDHAATDAFVRSAKPNPSGPALPAEQHPKRTLRHPH